MRVIRSGLNLGDRVVVDNLLKIRPNIEIAPIESESVSETQITREDGVVVYRDGSQVYDGLYEWSLENAERKQEERDAQEEQSREDDSDV